MTKYVGRVFRYEIPISDEWHEFPEGKVVFATPHRKMDAARVEIWVLHDFDPFERQTPPRMMGLRVYGTGHPISEPVEHVYSFRDDPLVWHVMRSNNARGVK